jgi:antagonist of KipI
MSLRVLEPGFLAMVQDLGRTGYESLGVPVNGVMDAFALRAANALVGNPPRAAGLEFTLQDLVLQAQADCLVALAGTGYELAVDGRTLPAWMAVAVRRRWIIHLHEVSGGGWGYLAVNGGITVPPVMGSRSTYLRGGFGGFDGRLLQAGDILPVGPFNPAMLGLAGRRLPPELRPAYARQAAIEVILGPQADYFTEAGIQTYLESEYAVTHLSDRMGYRLDGPPVQHTGGADILSEGVCFGSVQVPADGKPIVLMADRQTAGGYAKIATVISADLPLLAQCPPGSGRVRFRATTVSAAQARYRVLLAGISDSLAGGLAGGLARGVARGVEDDL